MKRFVFSFERLRHIRRLEMEQRAASVERARNAVSALDLRAAEMAREVSGARQYTTTHGAGFTDLGNFEDWTSRARARVAEERRQAVTALERERAGYVAARQRSEILEKLHDRAFDQWKRDYGKEQDDLAS